VVASEHKPGSEAILADNSPVAAHGVVFEDDGETGYFYALDLLPGGEQQIVDAVHIYDVSRLADRHQPSILSVLWSTDGTKSCLVINGQPHAVFDFKSRRGYSRNDYPNSPPAEGVYWNTTTHAWDVTALRGFDVGDTDRSAVSDKRR
jgi:hypothetical protein